MNILLVDDHAETRKETRALIDSEKDMTVVAEAATGEEGVVKTSEHKPDLVVMDIILPGINGIEATKTILANHPNIKILALSNYSGTVLVQALLKAGARGYVHKGNAFEELVPAIRAIAEGKPYLGKGISE